MPLKQLRRKEQGEQVMGGETSSVKWWVPESHFNQSICSFLSFINGVSAENIYCANVWSMLATTGKGDFLPFLLISYES